MRKGIIKKGKLRAILLSFVLIFTLSGCQHKDVYDTEIETGTYTAKLIYQQGALSWIPGDFEVIVDEINLSTTGYVKVPFENEPLSPVTLMKEIWLDPFPELDIYSRYDSTYTEEDTLDKLYKAETALEASRTTEDETSNGRVYDYIDYFDLFRVNGKIYMFHLTDMIYRDEEDDYGPHVLRIFRLVEEDAKQ